MTDSALARDLTHALGHHGYNTPTEVVEDVRSIIAAHQAGSAIEHHRSVIPEPLPGHTYPLVPSEQVSAHD